MAERTVDSLRYFSAANLGSSLHENTLGARLLVGSDVQEGNHEQPAICERTGVHHLLRVGKDSTDQAASIEVPRGKR